MENNEKSPEAIQRFRKITRIRELIVTMKGNTKANLQLVSLLRLINDSNEEGLSVDQITTVMNIKIQKTYQLVNELIRLQAVSEMPTTSRMKKRVHMPETTEARVVKRYLKMKTDDVTVIDPEERLKDEARALEIRMILGII